MNYSTISNFGRNNILCDTNDSLSNPLTYCMLDNTESRQLHGGESVTMDRDSRQCQLFMSQYCANKWDAFCEVASARKNRNIPNQGSTFNYYNNQLTAGEMLVKNTASRKYLVGMVNGKLNWERFDPTNAKSPSISYWTPNSIPEYGVNPKDLDNDPVMNKLLDNPHIAPDILINIYNTMTRNKTIGKLKRTRLGKYYTQNGLKL